MGKTTEISWANSTWSPWWGCIKVSPGCENCYMYSLTARWGYKVTGPAKTTERRLFGPGHWAKPLRWDKEAFTDGVRRQVFPSMCDPFEEHPQLVDQRIQLWALIHSTPNLDWLLLTKRPENVARMVPKDWMERGFPDNVWLGVSVENQEYADERIPRLMRLPAKVRFLSCEPLLGPVDLARFFWWFDGHGQPKLDWVIGGGESGGSEERRLVERCDHKAGGGERDYCPSCDGTGWKPKRDALEWARQMRDQCVADGVAFHWKQWGGPHHGSGGRSIDLREWQEMPNTAKEVVRA